MFKNASKEECSKIVEYLIDEGANINIQSVCKWTALMWASKSRYLNIVEYLVDKKADINIKNNNGDTALILALNEEDCDIIKYLINKGADVNIKNNKGETALILISNMRDNNNNNIINSILANATSHESDTLLNGKDLKTISILIGNGVNYKSSNSGMGFDGNVNIKIENDTIQVINEKSEKTLKYNKDKLEEEN